MKYTTYTFTSAIVPSINTISAILASDEGNPIKESKICNFVSAIKQQESTTLKMNFTYTPAYSPTDLVVQSIDKNGLMVIHVSLVVGVTEDMQWIIPLVDSSATCSYVSLWHT